MPNIIIDKDGKPLSSEEAESGVSGLVLQNVSPN